jgi:Fe-S cluster assembly protein SufD
MTPVAERQETYVTAFDAFRCEPAFGPARLGAIREAAFARFMARGFPTTRDEEWKFTSVAPIAETAFVRPALNASEPTGAALAPFLFDGTIRTQIVVVNGRVSKTLSSLSALPAGVTVASLRDVFGITGGEDVPLGRLVTDASPFAALNTAFFDDGVLIRIAPNAIVEEPLHVLFVATAGSEPTMASTRLLVVASTGSQARIVESYAGIGSGVSFTNAVTEILLSEGAVVDHYKIQRERASAFHTAGQFVRCGRSATFSSHSLSFGGRLVRNDVAALLEGDGAECTLNGLYIAGGDSLVDNHTLIDHAAPHCPSHEVYKGVLSGRAKAVFNGKIIVRKLAQKTNAKQTNKALLLSDDAQINTKPQLEIFADDVKCTHGAAIGQLDEDALFYLRARGIGLEEARNMLVHAFVGEILDRVKIGSVRQRVEQVMHDKLPRA